MKIVIAGSGETGSHLASMLSVENQDIVLIDEDKQRLEQLDLEDNFLTYNGSPLSLETLGQCGVRNADLFVAVTPSETVNIIACQMAKSIGGCRTIARVDSDGFYENGAGELLKEHGVDSLLFPERLAASRALHFIRHSWINEWFSLGSGELVIAGVRLISGSPIAGMKLRNLATGIPRTFHISAIHRNEKVIIPRGNDTLEEGDMLYFSILPSNLDMLRTLMGIRSTDIRRVMISGGGRITESMLEMDCRKLSITVFDGDRERCVELASKFPDITVVNATSKEFDAMRDEGIEGVDVFLAMTGSSETNLVSCMIARKYGVPRVLARLEEQQYVSEADILNIDKVISKKKINAGAVLNSLLDADMGGTQCLTAGGAEVAMLTAGAGSSITALPIKDLVLPQGVTIAGLIRNGRGMLVEGSTKIEQGDQVIVFFVTGRLTSISKMFR